MTWYCMVLHRMVLYDIALHQSNQLFHIISNDEAREKSAGLAEKVSGDKSAETFLFILFPPNLRYYFSPKLLYYFSENFFTSSLPDGGRVIGKQATIGKIKTFPVIIISTCIYICICISLLFLYLYLVLVLVSFEDIIHLITFTNIVMTRNH